MLLLVCALLPLVLGAALPGLHIRRRGARMAYVLLSTCLTSALALYLIVNGGGERIEIFHLTDTLTCTLTLDGAGKVYLALAAVLWPLAVLYAIDYMKHEKREGHFFTWYTMTYGAAVLLAFAQNLFTLYIAYEFLTLFTLPLVWHELDKESIRAVRIYMLFLFSGAALGFVALVGFATLGAGAFTLGGTITENGSQWVRVFCLLGFVGFGAKAAVLPLTRWLPTASVAPTPVTALLHAVAVVNAGVFAVMRVLYYVVSPALIRGTWAQGVMLALSTATVLYGAARAVRETHLKRRLAWSTVSNLSYMLLGLSLLTEHGMAAGLSHMVFHGLMKIVLFFCAGSILVQTGRTSVRTLHGLGKFLPLTFGAYVLAGASLMGVPPMPGFVSKYALVTAAFEEGGALAIAGAVSLLVAAVLTAVYIFTVVFPAFFMKPVLAEGETFQEGGWCMRLALVLLSALVVLAGVHAGRIMGALYTLAGGGGL
ncbi:MAG: proton-conducting membrane transporter [Clostridia bacterium]|nr:proton-conducting membrane transporter [Clostridia bacterium]